MKYLVTIQVAVEDDNEKEAIAAVWFGSPHDFDQDDDTKVLKTKAVPWSSGQ